MQVISILDMIRDAIPSKVEPAGKDVLSLSEAMYVRELSYSLRTLSRMPVGEPEGMSDKELFAKVFACHNADGWSPVGLYLLCSLNSMAPSPFKIYRSN